MFARVFVSRSHLHLASLVLLEDEAQLVRVWTRNEPQRQRTLTHRKLLEQIYTRNGELEEMWTCTLQNMCNKT